MPIDQGCKGFAYERDADGSIGQKISAVKITFAREDGGFTGEVKTDASGYYQMALNPGRYLVTATHPDYAGYSSAPGFYVAPRGGVQTGNIFMRLRKNHHENCFVSRRGKLNVTEEYGDPINSNRRYRLPAYKIRLSKTRYNVSLELIDSHDKGAVAGLVVQLISTHDFYNSAVSIFFADAFASVPGCIYKLENGEVSTYYKRPRGRIYNLASSPSETLYFSDSNDFYLYKLENGVEKRVYTHSTYLRDVEFDSRGNLYFSEATGAGGDGYIYRLDGSTATVFYRVRVSQVGFWAGNFAFDRNDSLWLSSGNKIPADLYKISDGAAQRVFTSQDECISGFSFEQSGNLIYANSENKVYRLTVPEFRRSEIYVFSAGEHLSDVSLGSSSSSRELCPLPHDVTVSLQYVVPERPGRSRRDSTWKDVVFDEVRQAGEQKVGAIRKISSRPELDGIYRAMSEAKYRCQLKVRCEANLCYLPPPGIGSGRGASTYIRVRAGYDQILPFHFPIDGYDYVYPSHYTPIGEVALIPHQVSMDQTIYEDTTQPALFYFLPEEFRLTRDDVAPYHSTLNVAFHTLTNETGNTLDPHQIEFTFKAVPYLRRERIRAALSFIEQRGLVPAGTIPSLVPLNPESARFFLTLPKEGGGFKVVERKEAHVVFNRHILDTVVLPSREFAEVFHSMRVGGESLNGYVRVKLPGRDDEQRIVFSGHLEKMVGPITEQFLVNQSSVDQKTYKIRIVNAIESTVTLQEGIFYLRFDPDHDRWIPATAAPGTFPLGLRSGEEKEIAVISTQPISHAWSVRLESIKSKIEFDFESLWLSVQETPGWQDLTHNVAVQVEERYFKGSAALDKVVVTFNDEEAIITLTTHETSKTVKLVKPFLLYLLRDTEANDYVYKVESYRNQQVVAFRVFPKRDDPILDIIPPLDE